MNKLKYVYRDSQVNVKYSMKLNEHLNEVSLSNFSIAGINLFGFMKIVSTRHHTIEYEGLKSIPLHDWLKTPHSAHDFFFVVYQVVMACSSLQESHLSTREVLYHTEAVFYNTSTKGLQLLFCPIKERKDDNDPLQFIQDLAASYKCDTEEGQNSISRFYFWLQGQRGFVPEDIERTIDSIDPEIGNVLKHGAVTAGPAPKPAAEERGWAVQSSHREPSMPQPAASSRPQARVEPDAGATVVLADQEEPQESGATSLLWDNQEAVHYPSMERKSTGEKRDVDKKVFVIGKGRNADWMITDNPAVSHSHASIVTRGNSWYVEDLESTNHTYLNGRKLSPHQEFELNEGDEVKLGNEVFLFHV